jgi:hypothetical protein
MTEVALAAEALQYLPTVVNGAEELWAFITKVRSANEQNAEWTADIEAAYQQQLLARTAAPEQQPDAPNA